MFTKNQLVRVIGGALVVSSAAITPLHHAWAEQAAQAVVQITDSKLAPINMGLDSAQHWLEKMAQGDTQRGQKLINDLERLATRFQRIPQSGDAQYVYVANRFAQIAQDTISKANQQVPVEQPAPSAVQITQQPVPQVQAVEQPTQQAVAKPHRNLTLIQSTLRQVAQGLAGFQAGDIVEAQYLTEKIRHAQKLYNDVPVSSHHDYTATSQLMESVEASFTSVIPQWSSAEDPSEFLAAMNSRYRQELSLPEYRRMMMARELTAADVQYFLGSIEAFNADIDTDLPRIIAAAIATRSRRDISLIDWLQDGAPKAIVNTTENLQKGLDTMIDRAIDDTRRLASLDPESNRYQFVTESVRNKHEEAFARTLRTLENVVALETVWQQPGRWSSKRDELNEFIAGYRSKVAQANTVDQLPDDIGDTRLARIASDTLAIEKYGVGAIEKLIVNSKKVQRDRETTRWFNSRLETTVRVWEEFQVCTVELEDGKYVVYHNTLRKFSRGATTTPIDTWLLADRFKSGEVDAALLN